MFCLSSIRWWPARVCCRCARVCSFVRFVIRVVFRITAGKQLFLSQSTHFLASQNILHHMFVFFALKRSSFCVFVWALALCCVERASFRLLTRCASICTLLSSVWFLIKCELSTVPSLSRLAFIGHACGSRAQVTMCIAASCCALFCCALTVQSDHFSC